MKRQEQLKTLKDLYDYLEELTKDSSKQLELMLKKIEDMYESIYDEMDQKDLSCGCDCPKCHKELLMSDLIAYTYFCNDCEENFYSHEVEIKKEKMEESHEKTI